MSDDPYLFPGTTVLRNKLDIRSATMLDRVERRLVTQRIRQGAPSGDFDLLHLQAIHHHLFQDLYDWAGEVRTVEMSKGGQLFQFTRYIRTGMAYVHRQVVNSGYLADLSTSDFASHSARIIGDINHVHPFREGNGRSHLLYLWQLSERAGHPIDLGKLDQASWIEASREANQGRYDAIARAIATAIVPRPC